MKLFLDLETTGVRRNYDEITQVTIILTDDNYMPKKLYNNFFRSDKINSVALEIQGLTLEEYLATHLLEFKSEASIIINLLKEANYEVYAYNQSFDVGMLKSNLEKVGYPTPQIKGIDLMKKRIKLSENMVQRGYSLDEVLIYTRKLFGEARGLHDARVDTVCNMLIARDDKL